MISLIIQIILVAEIHAGSTLTKKNILDYRDVEFLFLPGPETGKLPHLNLVYEENYDFRQWKVMRENRRALRRLNLGNDSGKRSLLDYLTRNSFLTRIEPHSQTGSNFYLLGKQKQAQQVTSGFLTQQEIGDKLPFKTIGSFKGHLLHTMAMSQFHRTLSAHWPPPSQGSSASGLPSSNPAKALMSEEQQKELQGLVSELCDASQCALDDNSPVGNLLWQWLGIDFHSFLKSPPESGQSAKDSRIELKEKLSKTLCLMQDLIRTCKDKEANLEKVLKLREKYQLQRCPVENEVEVKRQSVDFANIRDGRTLMNSLEGHLHKIRKMNSANQPLDLVLYNQAKSFLDELWKLDHNLAHRERELRKMEKLKIIRQFYNNDMPEINNPKISVYSVNVYMEAIMERLRKSNPSQDEFSFKANLRDYEERIKRRQGFRARWTAKIKDLENTLLSLIESKVQGLGQQNPNSEQQIPMNALKAIGSHLQSMQMERKKTWDQLLQRTQQGHKKSRERISKALSKKDPTGQKEISHYIDINNIYRYRPDP